MVGTQETTMDRRPHYPEFSSIRSHLDRAEADRGVEIGYLLADALIDAGDALRRVVSGVHKNVTQFIGALHNKS
jgi:hypothetical protein